jgi:hypothetical protein
MMAFCGILFGISGIISHWEIVFVPLGLLCTFFSLFQNNILLALISLITNVIAIITSPTLLLTAILIYRQI